MLTIGILNIVSIAIISIMIIILLFKLFRVFRSDSSLIFILISFFLLFLVTLTNIFEHWQIATGFDNYEDELEIIFIPLFILAVFSYCLKKELEANKKKEQKLKENNLRLNTSVRGASQALWEWYPDKNLLAINKRYCFLDFEPLYYEISESNQKEVVHPETLAEYQNLINALQTNSILPDNTEILLKSFYGNYKWVLFRGAKTELSFNNQYVSYLGTILGISHFKNAQFELEKARIKAEESEKLKTAFLNNISHEIRTPMNAIVGFTDLLIDPQTKPEKQKKYIEFIVQGCERLINIIEDLIEISQIVAGSIKTNPTQINARAFMQMLYEMFSPLAKRKKIKLTYFLNSELDFITDEEKLLKIFRNLLDNAFKFTISGYVEFGMSIIERNIQFYVKDSGIGIERDFHDSLFKYFSQREDSESRFHAGAGIGLSICKGLTNILGGKIWIDSTPNEGTTVNFALPIQEKNPLPVFYPPDDDLIINLSKKPVILIADDEESNYLYLKEVLQPYAQEIIWARTGQEAIDLYIKHTGISIIFMDIKMPVVNGSEAAIEIKKINPLVPIIMQTAYTSAPDEEILPKHCYDNFITKPINKNTLLAFIGQYSK
ncbi:MAG: response regulator [Bacteroidales bacterium]|nr:response regulator [Bacteroidales bacterium]